MSLIVAGLDLSLTNTGICVLEDNCRGEKSPLILIKDVVKPKKHKGISRLIYIRDRIIGLLDNSNVSLICIEGYSFGSQYGRGVSIGELGGVVRVSLFEYGFKILIIPPACLKKFIAGKGNAPKEQMLMKTFSKYGIEFDDNNICDAYGLARMGISWKTKYHSKQYEKEALAKIEILKD